MTEAEWLGGKLPAMLELLREKVTGRKLRLFACSQCRDQWPETPHPDLLRAYFVAERLADGMASEEERDEVFHLTTRTGLDRYHYLRSTEIHEVACCDTQYRFSMLVGFAVGWLADNLETHITSAHRQALVANVPGSLWPNNTNHPAYLRDIFGNPFRPVAIDPAWRTSTAVALAGQMYESRDFGAIPILADALQDAECDHEEVLNHCRGPGPHVRGCWVVDLVLGKV
jgi:hypothetical protein